MTAANDSRYSWRWFDCRPRYCLLGAVAVAAILLGGCSRYWVKDGDPVPETALVEVDTIQNCSSADGNGPVLGCAWRSTGRIEILKFLPSDLRSCLVRHERAHLLGWQHPDNRLVYRLDCGPEEL